jgi:hypothetical protein
VTAKEVRDFLEDYCQISETAVISITGSITDGSAIITGIADTSNLKPYMKISGTGIQAGAVIQSVDSSSQITMDLSATTTDSDASLTVTYYTQISDDWIYKRLNNFIIPSVEQIIRQKLGATEQITEYYSGNGKNFMILNRRPIVSLDEIRYVLGGSNFTILNLQNIEVVSSEGILKAKRNYEEAYYLPVFARGDYNLKITYTYGYATCPDIIKEAIIFLTAEQILGFIGSRTGGGGLSTQGYNRSFGNRGKFTEIRNDFARQAHFILSNYMTGVVG